MDLDLLFLDKNAPMSQSRKKLPHWNQDNKLQMITFHLADSLPKDALGYIEKQLNSLESKYGSESSVLEKIRKDQRRLFIERMNDKGYGSCIFKDKRICDVMERTLLYFDEMRYLVHAYVIMPNHVHILVEVFEGEAVEKIYHSWKHNASILINRILGVKEMRFPAEPWDRLIRNEAHYLTALSYIYKNMRSGGVRMKNFTRYVEDI